MANLLFLGLNNSSHSKLESILRGEGHYVFSVCRGQALVGEAVFCDGDDAGCLGLVSEIRTRWPGLPVIIVTERPEERKWLDALEAGAADYCSAPFERIQVRWILDAVFNVRLATNAGRAA